MADTTVQVPAKRSRRPFFVWLALVLVLVVVAVGAALLAGAGRVTGYASFDLKCPSDKPIRVAVRNLTFDTAYYVKMTLLVVPTGSSQFYSDTLSWDSDTRVTPFSEITGCTSTDYVTSQLPAADSGTKIDVGAVLDQADARREFVGRHSVEVQSVAFYNNP